MTGTIGNLRPAGEEPRFDVARLQSWLENNVEHFHGPLRVQRFSGGQSNPTYLLYTPGKLHVMRCKPSGALLPSAHAVDREYRVISALAATDVPVPRTYALCTDEQVIGVMFYVMDCIEGRVLWDPTLPGLAAGERAAIFDEMNRVLAALHRVDVDAVGLADFGKPGAYLERQVTRWTKQYRASETEKIDAMERLIDWLPHNVPACEETRVVHGDFRLDNLVFHPTEPRVLAVLDWELSTLGHPLADFAYHCMTWRLPPGKFRGLAGTDLPALGIPDEAAYVAAYCARTGRAPIPTREWEYYIAFNMFRLAAILQGIAARAAHGNASSSEAIETGQRARPLAEAAWHHVERIVGNR